MNPLSARLLSVGHLDVKPGWSLPEKSHLCHEIIVVIRGKTHVVVDREPITASVGDILLYCAQSPHCEHSDPAEGQETYFMSIEWPSMPEDSSVCLHDTHGRIRQLIQWLYAEWHDQVPSPSDVRTAFFNAILAEWLRLQGRQEHPTVQAVQSYIQKHISENITLAALARQAHMSKFHFLRCFKKLSGRTPMEQLRISRVEYAKSLILTTDLPLKDIASRAGMGNQYHLSRLFRRYLNVTPGEVRTAQRSMNNEQ
ncbi:MAG TPA: AraC family transcriptional regulator [Phycisphaerae bacterium]|nr:AraC family transcriptional regulator [Phycisphaerae bacterium]